MEFPERLRTKRYVASCSFGKDSMATVLLALMHNEPLNEVVYCEVMFDQNTSGEVPEHRDFIHGVAVPFLEKHGIRVNIVKSEKIFVTQFNRRIGGNGRNCGKIWSWPLCGRCYVQRDLKVRTMDAWKKKHWRDDEIVQYVGIANDETDRIAKMDSYKYQTVSLLEKYKFSENDAFELCKKNGLLSPIYKFAPRNGCFFCPNAKAKELRHLYDHHPDLWSKLLALQSLPDKATECFNRVLTITEIDAIFRLEDAQYSLFKNEEEIIPYTE